MELTRLTVSIGGRSHTLDEAAGPFRIGSGAHSDLVVDDPRVAEHHVSIDHEGPAWVVRAAEGTSFYSGTQAFDAVSVPVATTLSLGAPDGPVLALSPENAAPVATGDAGLYLRTEEGEDRVFGTQKPVVVGSDPSCDFVVEDSLVSPQHVRFDPTPVGWTLTDLNTPGGTYVDGRRLSGTVPAAGAFVVRLAAPVAGPELAVVTEGEHKTPRNRLVLIVAGIAALALVVALVAAVVASQRGDEDFPPLDETIPSSVFLQCSWDEGTKTYTVSGSGTVVGDDLVLTNFHVAGAAAKCGYFPTARAGDGEERTDDEARDTELMAYDEDLDLAVLHVVGDFDQPALEIGDSDEVRTGDAVRIVGYPGVGSTSVTVTDGIVSGRYPASTANGPWIKTDASIAGGNSGGMAIDTEGRIIGVPTRVQALRCESGAQVSCDGYSLGMLRPINEAAALIEEAENATEPIPVSVLQAEAEEPSQPEDPGDEPGDATGSLKNLRFGGRDEDGSYIAGEDGVLSSQESSNACVWFDTADAPAGSTYEIVAQLPTEKVTGDIEDAQGGDTTDWSFCILSLIHI